MAQLISQELNTAQRRVQLRFMDCFGSERRNSVSLLGGPSVSEKTESTLASMVAGEEALKTYLAPTPEELSRLLAAGSAAIAEAVADAAAQGISPPA